MLHDADLLRRLEAMPQEPFAGDTFRATRLGLHPLAASFNGGRWMPPDAAAVLYTSLAREGALAEIAFHWSRLTPLPTRPVLVHRLRVASRRTLCLLRADLSALGVAEDAYAGINLPRTQAIGAAVDFLGCDGLIAPSARWPCDNLMLFPDRLGEGAALELVSSETLAWAPWARENGFLAD